MAAKKSIWVLSGILVISVWILGSTIQAGADTMKCKTSNNLVKREVMSIPDVEGHRITMGMRDGLAFFGEGEVATYKLFFTSDTIADKGGLVQGYVLYTFVDGSSIITSFHQLMESDPEGKFAWLSNNSTGEILKGTGRFEGIKGSASGTSKIFKAEKGELLGKSTGDVTFTYTLSSK